MLKLQKLVNVQVKPRWRSTQIWFGAWMQCVGRLELSGWVEEVDDRAMRPCGPIPCNEPIGVVCRIRLYGEHYGRGIHGQFSRGLMVSASGDVGSCFSKRGDLHEVAAAPCLKSHCCLGLVVRA